MPGAAPSPPTAALALCRELPALAPDAPLPERLLLAPAGEIQGRDGRVFRCGDPAALAAAWDGQPIPVDFEHATHLAAPHGQRADAAGWIESLHADAAGLWGAVAWTPAGAEALRSRAYRFISPAYFADPTSGDIRAVPSVGLTNRPNLDLPALNRPHPSVEDRSMPLSAALAAALALAADATDEQAVAAANALRTERDTALNRAQTPDLNAFVPRAELELALNRATQAETALRDAQAAELNRQVEALIAEGLGQTGQPARIAPGTVDYHRAQAQTPGGLERLRAYLNSAPPVLAGPAAPTGAPPAAAPALNAEAAAIAAAFGNTPEILAQFGDRP